MLDGGVHAGLGVLVAVCILVGTAGKAISNITTRYNGCFGGEVEGRLMLARAAGSCTSTAVVSKHDLFCLHQRI